MIKLHCLKCDKLFSSSDKKSNRICSACKTINSKLTEHEFIQYSSNRKRRSGSGT